MLRNQAHIAVVTIKRGLHFVSVSGPVTCNDTAASTPESWDYRHVLPSAVVADSLTSQMEIPNKRNSGEEPQMCGKCRGWEFEKPDSLLAIATHCRLITGPLKDWLGPANG